MEKTGVVMAWGPLSRPGMTWMQGASSFDAGASRTVGPHGSWPVRRDSGHAPTPPVRVWPRTMQSGVAFDPPAEHAACGHALALLIVEWLHGETCATPARLQRAKAWASQTASLLEQTRQRAQRWAAWRPVLTLLERQVDVAAALEEALFLMSLPTEPSRSEWPAPVRRSLQALAQTVLGAQQDQVRAIEVARHLDPTSPSADGEALLDAVWRILQAERTGDELLRAARQQIVQTLHAHAPCLQLATELATTLEGATDRQLSAAFALRNMVFEPVGGVA